jgi:acetyltransferase-like isoleucine patch superfamily enzyme
MNKISQIIRGWLLRFLGVHDVCTLLGDEFFSQIANRLLYVHRVYGPPDRLSVGQEVVLNDTMINTNSGRVTVMDHVFCGHGVSIITGTHNAFLTGIERQRDFPSEGRDIRIEEGVWIGSNATILGPCVVGRHAVIAAGSVVRGDVEAGCFYAGVPARKVREIDLKQPVSPVPRNND